MSGTTIADSEKLPGHKLLSTDKKTSYSDEGLYIVVLSIPRFDPLQKSPYCADELLGTIC
jgi:hypothetical protein